MPVLTLRQVGGCRPFLPCQFRETVNKGETLIEIRVLKSREVASKVVRGKTVQRADRPGQESTP